VDMTGDAVAGGIGRHLRVAEGLDGIVGDAVLDGGGELVDRIG
jgi:hypothetical protein